MDLSWNTKQFLEIQHGYNWVVKSPDYYSLSVC